MHAFAKPEAEAYGWFFMYAMGLSIAAGNFFGKPGI